MISSLLWTASPTWPPSRVGNLLHKIWLTARPGDQVILTIKRAGRPAPLILSPTFRAAQGTGDAVSFVRRGADQIMGMYPLLFLVVGLTVLFFRWEDRNAWLLALMFGGFISMSGLPTSLITASVPLRHFIFAYNSLFKSLLPGLFYFFFAVFPTRSPIDRRLPWLKWAFLLVEICLGWGGIFEGDSVALPFVVSLFRPTRHRSYPTGHRIWDRRPGLDLAVPEFFWRPQYRGPAQAQGDAVGNSGGHYACHRDRHSLRSFAPGHSLLARFHPGSLSCFCCPYRSPTRW